MLVDDWIADEGGLADGEAVRFHVRERPDDPFTLATVTRVGNALNCELVTEGTQGTVRSEVRIRVFMSGAGPSARRVFNCPDCGALVERLYLSDLHLVCRRCARLLYPSQLMSAWERAKVRREKIRARLGPSEQEPGLPTRPKGMHQATYERLLDELAELDVKVQAMLEEDPYALIRLGLTEYLIADDYDGETGYRYPPFKRSRGAKTDGSAAGRGSGAGDAPDTSRRSTGGPSIQAIKGPVDVRQMFLASLRRTLAEMEAEAGEAEKNRVGR
jgi:hypothetical protein